MTTAPSEIIELATMAPTRINFKLDNLNVIKNNKKTQSLKIAETRRISLKSDF